MLKILHCPSNLCLGNYEMKLYKGQPGILVSTVPDVAYTCTGNFAEDPSGSPLGYRLLPGMSVTAEPAP